MIETPIRPDEVRVEKPSELNLAEMVEKARSVSVSPEGENQPQNWEVYVRLGYASGQEFIQRFTPDGRVEIVTKAKGYPEYEEYDFEYARNELREGILKLSETHPYRSFPLDISVVYNSDAEISGVADPLIQEFMGIKGELPWFTQTVKPAEIDERDRAPFADPEIPIILGSGIIEQADEEQLGKVRSELAAALNKKLDADKAAVEQEPEPISIEERLIANGFTMEAPEISDEEPEEVAEPEPIQIVAFPEGKTPFLGEQPPIEWPHLESVAEGTNGNGHKPTAEALDPENAPELPEGIRLIKYQTKTGKEQTRFQRVKDGKFVGQDGLTKKEREAKEVVLLEAKPRRGKGHGKNGNGHKKAHPISDTVPVAPAAAEPERRTRKARAPKAKQPEVPAPASTPEVEIVNFREVVLQSDEFSIVYLNGDQLRNLEEAQKNNLERMIRNLRVDADIPTLEELIKNMFGIDIKLVPPQKVPATA